MQRRVLVQGMVSLVIAACVWAQPPQGRGRRGDQGGPGDPQQMLEQRLERITEMLSLSGDQKTKATSIFADAARAAQPLRQQMREARTSLQAAVRANDAAQIDKLASTIGTLTAQSTAIESKAEAQFISTLTPEQVSKLPEGFGGFGLMGGGGPGGFGGPGGPGGQRGPRQQQ